MPRPETTGIAPVRRVAASASRFGFIVVAIRALPLMGSAACENLVRKRLIAQIETATGGRAEIGDIPLAHRSGGGGERPGDSRPRSGGEAPYAQVGQLQVGSAFSAFSVRAFVCAISRSNPPVNSLNRLSRRSTNQPQPRRPNTSRKRMLDSLFDLRADHVAVEQGTLDLENRAADFDFQNRQLRLDFSANDVSMLMAYMPTQGRHPEAIGSKRAHAI